MPKKKTKGRRKKKKTPKPFSKENILTDSEIEELKQSIRTDKEKLMVYGLLGTGMRVSEFVHLRVSWFKNANYEFINIPEYQVCNCYECKKEHIREEKKKNPITGKREPTGKKIVTKPANMWKPKTKSAIRIIYVLPELQLIFKEYFKEYDNIMDTIGTRITGWQKIKNVATRTTINHNVFCHAVRATYATILAEHDFDALAIKNIMGWKSIAIAESYVKMRAEPLKKMYQNKFSNKDV